MAAKTFGVFAAGLVVGAGLMFVAGRTGETTGPAGPAAIAGPEVATAPAGGAGTPAATGPAEPAPLPALAPAGATHAAAAGGPAGRTAPGAPGAQPQAGAPQPGPAGGSARMEGAEGAGKPATNVIKFGDGSGTVTFHMMKPPEEVLGKDLVAKARTAEPGTADHAEAFAGLRQALVSDDPATAHAARQVLDEMIAKERMLPGQVATLENDFRALSSGDAKREQLAAVIARARSQDDRIGEFLSALPTDGEPGVRRAVVDALRHERTAPAVHAWHEQLIQRETDAGVLGALLAPWRFQGLTTRRSAPGYVAALADRLQRGDLQSPQRGQALHALALAGIHAPEAAATLARAAQNDPDPKLRNFARDAEQIVRSGEANANTLQQAWQKQYPPTNAVSGGVMTFVADVKSADAKAEGEAGAGATGDGK